MKPYCIASAALIAALSLASPAAAQSMSVATFLQKVEALKAQGPLALMSSDIGLIKREVEAAGMANRAERKARLEAGQKPLACPPEKVSMSSDDLINHFRTIPEAQRGKTTIKAAMADMVRKKFPCPKG